MKFPNPHICCIRTLWVIFDKIKLTVQAADPHLPTNAIQFISNVTLFNVLIKITSLFYFWASPTSGKITGKRTGTLLWGITKWLILKIPLRCLLVFILKMFHDFSWQFTSPWNNFNSKPKLSTQTRDPHGLHGFLVRSNSRCLLLFHIWGSSTQGQTTKKVENYFWEKGIQDYWKVIFAAPEVVYLTRMHFCIICD